MKGIAKIIIVAVAITFLGYTIGSAFTLPTVTSANPNFDLSNMANYPPLPQSNMTFAANGQDASFWFMANVPIANWTKGTEYLLPFYVLKTSQNLTFPYSNATIGISDFDITVNGQSQGPSKQGIEIGNGSDVLTYMYILSPPESYSGVINLTVAFHVDLILISGIYWYSVSIGTESFSTNLSLLIN